MYYVSPSVIPQHSSVDLSTGGSVHSVTRLVPEHVLSRECSDRGEPMQ
jgi:hypothetical protein